MRTLPISHADLFFYSSLNRGIHFVLRFSEPSGESIARTRNTVRELIAALTPHRSTLYVQHRAKYWNVGLVGRVDNEGTDVAREMLQLSNRHLAANLGQNIELELQTALADEVAP